MREITLQEVWDFKDACKRVQAQRSIGRSGLCWAVDTQYRGDAPRGEGPPVYTILGRLLTRQEMHQGLGPWGVFTKARRHFLDFLINMPGEDMLDILNQDCPGRTYG